MKGYKALVPVLLVICMMLSFYMLINARTTILNEYNTYLSTARSCAKQGIAIEALENYAKALAIKNTIDINIEVGDFYVEMEDVTGAIGWGEMMVETFPDSPMAHEFLLKRYRESNDFNRCYALYDTIVKRGIRSKGITEIMNGIKYVYYYGEAYDDVGVFSEGYCAVKYEGKWGLANEAGEKTAPIKFKSVGPYIDGMAPVATEDGDIYYIDNQGNKKMAIQIEGEIAGLKSIVGDVYAVNNGTAWSFYNKKYEKLSSDYSNTSLLANTVVAVEKNGQWVILNDKFEKINDWKYIEIVQDDRGIIYRNGAIFVNQDGGYFMVDISGKKITKTKFLDAKLFLDTTYAAVEVDKGWTFVDAQGDFVFTDLYFEAANSFTNGFAAVKKGGQWGYIDLDGNVAIDFQFKEAKDFNASGCAFVKSDDIWQLLRLYSKNYES